MNRLRGYLYQWAQHELAFGHTRVGDGQVRRVDDEAAVQEDVDIQCARSVQDGAARSRYRLNAPDLVQQFERTQGRPDAAYGVDKRGLERHAHGGGLGETRYDEVG